MPHIARKVYEKLISGDSLTDQDISFGRTFYRELADKLTKCGPVFHLAWIESRRTADAFDAFWKERHPKSPY